MTYDWDGIRTRRIKLLKFGASLIIAATVFGAPAMVLLRSHH